MTLLPLTMTTLLTMNTTNIIDGAGESEPASAQ